MRQELKVMPRPTRASSPSMRDLLTVFFRYKRIWWLSFVCLFLAACAYGLLTDRYQAHMKVMVRHGRSDPIFGQALPEPTLLSHGEVSEEEINSEVELLQDDETLATVAQSAGLAAPGWFEELIGEDAPTRVAKAARRLRRRLEIEPLPRTNLIAVAYRSSDPVLATRVLACLGQVYLQHHAKVMRPPGELDFFEQQLSRSRLALQEAQGELLEFSRDEGVVSAGLQRDSALATLSETEATYNQIQVALAENEQRIGSLTAQLRSLPERMITQVRSADNPQLQQQIKGKLLELQLKRTELLTKYQPSYRLVQEVDRQIAETQATISAEEHSPLRDQTTDQDPSHEWVKAELVKAAVGRTGIEARLAATGKLLARLRETAEELGDRAVHQDALVQEVKAAEDQYLFYTKKREEARIGDALDRQNILNASIAEPPVVPVLPARSVLSVGLIGLLSAGTLSTGLIFAADHFNPAFRTPDEVLAYLGSPVLASLPPKGSQD
jgi:uncharacterized protein involved in exopolysaccharide biosynthesis